MFLALLALVSGRAGFTNYMMWSSRMSFLIPGDGSNVQVKTVGGVVFGIGDQAVATQHCETTSGTNCSLCIKGVLWLSMWMEKRVMSNGACGDWKSKWRFGKPCGRVLQNEPVEENAVIFGNCGWQDAMQRWWRSSLSLSVGWCKLMKKGNGKRPGDERWQFRHFGLRLPSGQKP